MAPLSRVVCLSFGLAALPGAFGLVSEPQRPFFKQLEDAFSGSARLHGRARKSGVPLKILITSIGCQDTAGLMNVLSEARPMITTNSVYDSDGLKHKPYSKLAHSEEFKAKAFDKIIYVLGDLTRCVMSLDQQGMFARHAAKTRTDEVPDGYEIPQNVLEYVYDTNDDFFQFEKHLDSFYLQGDLPIAFLRISEVFNHTADMAGFLEISHDEVKRIFEPWHEKTGFQNSKVGQYFKDREIIDELSAEKALEARDEFGRTINLASENMPRSKNNLEDMKKLGLEDMLKSKLASEIERLDWFPDFKLIIPAKARARD